MESPLNASAVLCTTKFFVPNTYNYVHMGCFSTSCVITSIDFYSFLQSLINQPAGGNRGHGMAFTKLELSHLMDVIVRLSPLVQ